MSQGRHIDSNCRFVWLSLRRTGRAMTVNELVTHWRPVFTAIEMEDVLQRLTSGGYATATTVAGRPAWCVGSQALPGYTAGTGRFVGRAGVAA